MTTTMNLLNTSRAWALFTGDLPAGGRQTRTGVTAAVRQAVRAYGGAPDARVLRTVAAFRRAGEPA